MLCTATASMILCILLHMNMISRYRLCHSKKATYVFCLVSESKMLMLALIKGKKERFKTNPKKYNDQQVFRMEML